MLTTEQKAIAMIDEFTPSRDTALRILRPGVSWCFRNDDLIVWESDLPYPTQEEIDGVITELVSLRSLYFIRQKRNERLKETDACFIEDFPITQENKNIMLTYRQTLRDLPETFTDNIPVITRLRDAEAYIPPKPVF